MPNNATKVISIAIVLTMIVGAFAVLATSGVASNTSAKQVSVADVEPMDVGPQIRSQQAGIVQMATGLSSAGLMAKAPGDYYQIGDIEWYYTGSYGKWYWNETDWNIFMPFEKRAELEHVEVWVCTDLSFPAGDPRNDGRIVINDTEVNYIAHEFNDTIYPIEKDNFGAPPPLTGENALFKDWGYPYMETNVSGRVMLMIFNIVDDSFFNPSYPSYIAGYFSPSSDAYYDRNIIHIDNWDWANRTTGSVSRPYVYESTVAHEYQHLLNNFHNPDQATFLNEGCSMYAEMLCGYGIPWSYVQEFLSTPDNSLTEWGDQGDINILADYGAAMLYVIWLHDHFGSDYVNKLVDSTFGEQVLSGIDDINAAFQEFGFTKWDFDRSFSSWRLANLLHTDMPGNGLYDYTSLDLGSVDAGVLTVQNFNRFASYPVGGYGIVASAAWQFGPSVANDGTVITGCEKLPSYGTDYIHLQQNLEFSNYQYLKFGFWGDAAAAKGWQKTEMSVAAGDSVFSDDFNHGGSNLPGWTLGALTAASLPVGWHAQLAEGSNYFAVANSEAAGYGISVSMYTTAGFSTADCQHLDLSFDSDFARDPADRTHDTMGYVWFSVDGGDWKLLTSVNQNQGNHTSGIPMAGGNETVVVNADDLVGFNNVKLMFTYEAEAAMGWWAIDNVNLYNVSKTPVWWSDRGDLVDYSLVGSVDLSSYCEGDEVTLGLDTMWNLEDQWDFGFAQVSTDGGMTWQSLEGDFTTYDHDLSALPLIIDNLPGITGESPSWGETGWDALDHITFDLSDYAGEQILLQFREITDWATNYDGWFIKNVTINDVLIDNADDVVTFEPVSFDPGWMVSIVATNGNDVSAYDGLYYLPIVLNLYVDNNNMVQRALDSLVVYSDIYIVVSPRVGWVDYGFGMSTVYPLLPIS